MKRLLFVCAILLGCSDNGFQPAAPELNPYVEPLTFGRFAGRYELILANGSASYGFTLALRADGTFTHEWFSDLPGTFIVNTSSHLTMVFEHNLADSIPVSVEGNRLYVSWEPDGLWVYEK